MQGSREPTLKKQRSYRLTLSFMPSSINYKLVPFESVGQKKEIIMSVHKPTTEDVGKHLQQQRCMNAEEILTQDFGNWEVKDDGEILYRGSEIAIKEIPAIGLRNEHLTQMLGKFRGRKSEDAAEFYFAYLQALNNAGYKSLTIDLTQIHNIKIEK